MLMPVLDSLSQSWWAVQQSHWRGSPECGRHQTASCRLWNSETDLCLEKKMPNGFSECRQRTCWIFFFFLFFHVDKIATPYCCITEQMKDFKQHAWKQHNQNTLIIVRSTRPFCATKQFLQVLQYISTSCVSYLILHSCYTTETKATKVHNKTW